LYASFIEVFDSTEENSNDLDGLSADTE